MIKIKNPKAFVYFIITLFSLAISERSNCQIEKYDTLSRFISLADTINHKDSSIDFITTARIFSNKYISHEKFFSLGTIISQIAAGIDQSNNKYQERDSFIADYSYIFKHCKISGIRKDPDTFQDIEISSFEPYNKKFIFKNEVVIEDCRASGLYFENINFEEKIKIYNNYFPIIQGNNTTGIIYALDNIHLRRLDFSNCSLIDISEIGNTYDPAIETLSLYTNSNISGYTNYNNSFKTHQIKFTDDSLFRKFKFGIQYIGTPDAPLGDTLEIEFRNSYIDCSISILTLANYQTVIFNKCTFGKNADIIDVIADRVHFINCNELRPLVIINLMTNNSGLKLELTNTSLERTRFTLSKNTELFFPENATQDIVTNTYESLLKQFKTEGKFESYKQLDIQYRNLMGKKGNLFERILNFLNRIWWNYGYSKSWVILWTLCFLFMFFIVNLILWKEVQAVYPVNEDGFVKNKLNVINKIRYFSSVFLYTSFIFFSLRLDFDKIKFSSTRMVALLLLQYLTGLICLLFITSAIIKF